VARRDAAAGSARGGEVIPALRPDRARLITGAGSLAALGAVAAYAAFGGSAFAGLGDIAGGAGGLVLVIGIVFRLPIAIPWAVVLAAVDYAVGRTRHSTVDGWAAAVGGALLLSAELAWWSIDHDRRVVWERRLVVRRSAAIATLVTVSVLVGFVLVGAAAISAGAGLLLTAVGVAAAVAAVGTILRLARA
jgi:hypothetical protein